MGPAVLLLITTFGPWLTFPFRTAFVRRLIPQARIIDEVLGCIATLIYLVAAVSFTVEAHRACEWVNRQHAENVYNAGLGPGFFTMIWLMFLFAAVVLTSPHLAERWKKARSVVTTEVGAQHSSGEVMTSNVRLKNLGNVSGN
jgi:hypothetical protein